MIFLRRIQLLYKSINNNVMDCIEINVFLSTGLDPAAILFDGFPDYVKLTKKDAMFVDVIHTDAPPSLAISKNYFKTFSLG